MAFSPERFQLSLVNQLEAARFAVEKITDTFLGQDGKIYYKVRWQETWEPEEKLMTLCAQLVNDFWKDYYAKSQQSQHQLPTENQQHNASHHTPHGSHQLHDGLHPHHHSTQQSHMVGPSQAQAPVEQPAQTLHHVIVNHAAPPPNLLQSHHLSQMLNTPVGPTSSLASPTSVGNCDPVAQLNAVGSAVVDFRFSSPVIDKRSSQITIQSRMLAPVNPLLPRYQFLPPLSESTPVDSGESAHTKPDAAAVLAGTSKSLSCTVCKKQFSMKHNLLNHQLVHTNERPLECEHCGKRFRSKPGLIRHVSIHNGGLKPHQCEVCQKGFRERSNLKKHMLIHSDMRPHSCEVCGARFRQLGHLLKHLLVHKPDKPHKCDVCGKGFKRKEHLKEHAVLHTGDFPFACEECGKKFRFKTNLKVHLTSHSGRKDFVCDICGKAFIGKANLTQHALIHEPEFNYSCEICGKKFKRKGHLRRHKDIHKNDRNLSCVFCKEQFLNTALLRRHLLIHTGNKPFVCIECGKRFASRSYLTQHKLIHSSEKPFSCDVCSKKFRHKASLQKHVSTHKGRALGCENCGQTFSSSSLLAKHMGSCARTDSFSDGESGELIDLKKACTPRLEEDTSVAMKQIERHKSELDIAAEKSAGSDAAEGDGTSAECRKEALTGVHSDAESGGLIVRRKLRVSKKTSVRKDTKSAMHSTSVEVSPAKQNKSDIAVERQLVLVDEAVENPSLNAGTGCEHFQTTSSNVTIIEAPLSANGD